MELNSIKEFYMISPLRANVFDHGVNKERVFEVISSRGMRGMFQFEDKTASGILTHRRK